MTKKITDTIKPKKSIKSSGVTPPVEPKAPKITKHANLADLLFKYPEIAEVLLDYGLHCVGCFASSFDTLEAGAKVHGMTDEEVDEMVNRLNEVVEFGE